MSSIPSYIPSLGALMAHGMRTLAQSVPPAPAPAETAVSDAPATQKDIATALKGALGEEPAVKSNARFSSVSITLNNGKGLDIDNAARLLAPKPLTGPSTSLRGIEINNSATANTVGERHGLVGSGLAPVWLENHGSIIGKNGAGVILGGKQDDEVVNAGLIRGSNQVALDMGDGNDVLIVKHGGRFEGAVDGGSGINQVILDDPAGGVFDGARHMQHLWVSDGTWTLTGAVEANKQGEVYSGATLINQSKIGGSMTVKPDATYSGGTVGHLDVAGTLRTDPATHIEHDLNMREGSTLAFAAGRDQPLTVGNTATLTGATLNIHVQDENDARLAEPQRIIDARQVEGEFASVTSNLKTHTPTLSYTPDGVYVAFKRTSPAIA